MKIIKRIYETIIAITLIILLCPFMILISLLIKLTSKGPVFFNQNRLGKNGHIFIIHKFRTMVINAENFGSGIYTNESDNRITKIGRFLRKTSLDELPQLFNIIKGQMSFVGPRPPVPYHPYKYEDYTDEQRLRFTVLPGLTGYAQILGRNSLNWDERIELDVYYVKNKSLLLDLKIIFLTFISVIKKENIYNHKE